MHADTLAAQLGELPTNELSDTEIAGLKFMREEETLARGVYRQLGTSFESRVFENIGASEGANTEAVALLLEKYDITDPVLDEAGHFANEELQSLYTELLAKGQESATAALRVGAEVEEVDILDIRERANATDDAAITLVYENLRRGSRKNLRAFVRNDGLCKPNIDRASSHPHTEGLA